MDMSTTSIHISQVQLVMVPATDQDRSIAFYESLGFEKRLDAPFGEGYRWVEVYPPGQATGLALVRLGPDDPVGAQTGIILHTHDIDATHAHMRGQGLDVDAQVARVGAPAEIRLGAASLAGPVPPMFWLRDPDGNRLLIIEPT
jgi:catechol 2,3-dioxygenase-like lactoylglutathione lyase family enzyme